MTFFPQKKVFDYEEPAEGRGLGLSSGSALRMVGISFLAAALIAGALSYFLLVRHTPFSVRAVARPGTVLIGETVRCDITVVSDRDDEVELIVPDKVFKGFSVRGTHSDESRFLRKKTLKKTYLLTRYSTGEVEVGQVEALCRGKAPRGLKTAKTGPIRVTFRALLPKERVMDRRAVIESKYFTGGSKAMGPGAGFGEQEDGGGHVVEGPVRLYIREKPEPKTVPTFKEMGYMLAAALGALVFFGAVVMVIVAIIKGMREKPPLLPYVEALEKLAGLKASGTSTKVPKKEFCSKLYSIMTDYVKARSGVTAGSMTAKEFIAFTDVLADLTVDEKEYLKKMATLCDLAKYSGYDPEDGELEGLVAEAAAFVRETMPKVSDA